MRRAGSLFVAFGIAISLCAQSGTTDKIEEIRSDEPWTQAPTEFRGVPFGASREEASRILGPMKCNEGRWKPAHLECTTTNSSNAFRLRGATIETQYIFHEGKFVGVTFGSFVSRNAIRPGNYRLVNKAFVEKYGKPTVQRTFLTHGTMAKEVQEYTVNRPIGGRIDYVPFEYKGYSAEWENEQMHAFLVSERDYELTIGAIETQAWRKAKEATPND